MRRSRRRRMTWTSTALLVALVFAGCLDAPPEAVADATQAAPSIVPGRPVEPFWDDPIHDGPDHDHADPKQHADHRNIELLGTFPRGADDKGVFGEIDIVGDTLLQCLYDGGGFRVLDLTDRAVPSELGRYTGPRCYDVKATADGALAIVSGTHLVDITEPDHPRLVSKYKQGGCHMCTIHEIGGIEYIFQARSFAMTRALVPIQGIVEITRIDRGDPLDTSTLSHVADWSAPIGAWPNTHLPDANTYEMSIHDMYVYDDPVLGIPLMVVAHWDLGVFFVDVSDPMDPRTIGHWDDFMGDCGDIHTVEVDFIDGKRIVAAATENGLLIDPACSAARWSVGFVYLIDASDLEKPATLGKWHIPGAGPVGRASEPWPQADAEPALVGAYSAHNLHFLEGRVYVAMYHGGVFVVDAAGFVGAGGAERLDTFLRKDTVPTLGAYFPTCGAGPLAWDLFLKDGHLYVSDMRCGLFVLRFLGDPLHDVAFTGDA